MKVQKNFDEKKIYILIFSFSGVPKVSCICVSNETRKPGNFNSAISNENLLLFRKWYITTPEIVYPSKEPNTCVSRNPFLFNFYEIFEIIIEEIINYYSMKKNAFYYNVPNNYD